MQEPRHEVAREHAHAIRIIESSLQEAISELDRIQAPEDIAAHVDAALQRLRELGRS